MIDGKSTAAKIIPSYVAALALGALGLAFCLGAFRLGFWTDDGPGPGLLPVAVGALLIPLLIVGLREQVTESETPFEIKPLIAIGATAAYALIVPLTGFVPATLMLLMVWIGGLYRQSWSRAAVTSVCLTAGGILIFVVLLKVPLKLFPAIG